MRAQQFFVSTNMENQERESREEKSWRRNHGASILGSIWEAIGQHLRSIREHMGGDGETYLAGVAERKKIMEDPYCVVQVIIVRKTSPEVLTLPGVLKVGVTKYRSNVHGKAPLQHRKNPYR